MKLTDFYTGTGTRNYQEEILQELQGLRRDISELRHILLIFSKQGDTHIKETIQGLRSEAEALDVYIDLRGQDRRVKIS